MEIHGKSSPGGIGGAPRAGERTQRNAEGSAGERVTLSNRVALLARLGQEIGSIHAVDHARVALLGRAVEEGRYAPPPREVAAALLREIEYSGGRL